MKKTWYGLLVLLLLANSRLHAQITTAQVEGKITDGKGERLPGVTIQLSNTATGFKTTTQSNEEGRFLITNLNAGGPYVLTASYVGFKNEEKSDLNLNLGTTTINFKLQDGAQSLNEVVVRASQGDLKTGAGSRMNQNDIKQMPALNRSLQDMTRMTPQSNNNSFLGTNFRYNNVTLDGGD